jgi:hypothetical protein
LTVAGSWYAETLRADISQGDVFSGVPFTTLKEPLTHLAKGSANKGDLIWVPTEGADTSAATPKHCLAHYRVGYGIVVSHDCAIDKPNRTTRFLFAPVHPLDTLSPKVQEQVRAQGHMAYMYLPLIGSMQESCLDLRLVQPIPRDIVASFQRIASLSDEGRERLQSALIVFFVSRDRTQQAKSAED